MYKIVQVTHWFLKPSEIRIWNLGSSMRCRRLTAGFSQQRTAGRDLIPLFIKKGLLLEDGVGSLERKNAVLKKPDLKQIYLLH